MDDRVVIILLLSVVCCLVCLSFGIYLGMKAQGIIVREAAKQGCAYQIGKDWYRVLKETDWCKLVRARR